MIKAMKQALLVLEDWKIHMRGDWDVIDEQAVTSLRQAIAEAEKQEPVAWMYWESCLNDDGTQTSPWVQRYSKFEPPESIINKEITPLYTHPQPKENL